MVGGSYVQYFFVIQFFSIIQLLIIVNYSEKLTILNMLSIIRIFD